MANITGTSGDDSLAGTSAADSIAGLAGNDVLAGGPGDDTLDGGEGFDAVDYFEASGPVTVNLVTGTASGADGNDVLISIEEVWGSDVNDTLTGDASDNILRGQRGNDTLDGGAGYDIADYFEATGAVIVNLATGTASGADGNDILLNIEDIFGGAFDDILIGDDSDNFVFGDDGDDILYGLLGDDTLDGGAGFDYVFYQLAVGPVIVDLAAGAVAGDDGHDLLLSIEGAVGGTFNDILIGDDNDNVLRGKGGNDTLDGGFGIDMAEYFEASAPVTVNLPAGTASGADGNDVLVSIEDVWLSDFADSLIGDANGNFVVGGQGDDTLDGGAGVDIAAFGGERTAFTIGAAGASVSGPDGVDLLTNIERLHFFDSGVAFDLGAGQAAGNTVRIIGAAFDAPAIQQHPNWVGIGLDFFDSGMSLQAVCALVAQLMGLSNTDFVTAVYTNVVGTAPAAAVRDLYVGLLQGSGGTMAQGELLVLAASAGVNATNIDLVGLQQSGVEFT